MESATAWPFLDVRVAINTSAPAAANRRAMPSPMPWPAPVTRATLFLSSPIMRFSRCVGPCRPGCLGAALLRQHGGQNADPTDQEESDRQPVDPVVVQWRDDGGRQSRPDCQP